MSTPDPRTYFRTELVAAGWQEETRASSTAYRRDRCLIVIGSQGGGGEITWTVFPTPPSLPSNVVTRAVPAPVGTFVVRAEGGRWHVTSSALGRDGKMATTGEFSGDERQVLAHLRDESVRRVDQFVKLVEAPSS